MLANKTAESMIVIKDNESSMFGISQGDGAPEWCTEDGDFDFICTIHPIYH